MMSHEEMHGLLVDAIIEALRECLSTRSDLVEVPIVHGAFPDSTGEGITINRKHVLSIERSQETRTRVVMLNYTTLLVAWTYDFTVRQLS